MLNKAVDATPYTITAQTFTCNGEGCYAHDCKIRLATYLLKMDVFNALHLLNSLYNQILL